MKEKKNKKHGPPLPKYYPYDKWIKVHTKHLSKWSKFRKDLDITQRYIHKLIICECGETKMVTKRRKK